MNYLEQLEIVGKIYNNTLIAELSSIELSILLLRFDFDNADPVPMLRTPCKQLWKFRFYPKLAQNT